MKKILLQLAIIAFCFLQAIPGTTQMIVTPGSVINNTQGDTYLGNWLNNNVSGTLLYRRSVNGASSSTFHSLCDNQGPTITLYKTSYGTVFGGYNSVSWNSYNGYMQNPGGFLFNLTTGRKGDVGGAVGLNNPYGTYNTSGYGPTFGGGHDIYMSSDMQYGYVNSGHSYNTLDGSPYNSQQAFAALAGPGLDYNSFPNGFITEIEVYKLTPGVPGGALNFDGVNDYVRIPRTNGFSSYDFINDRFTIEYWARPTTVDGNFHWVISKDNGNADLGFLSGLNSDNKWRFIFRNFLFDLSSTTTAVANQWYHVACTYDGATAKLYINGVLEASQTAAVTSLNNTSDVLIGARTASSPAQFFQGDIDEVRIWDPVLSDCEIKSTKDCQITNYSTTLLGYYTFNQGQINKTNTSFTTLPDVTGHLGGGNGTLSGFDLTGASSNWVTGKASGSCDNYVPPTATITAPQGVNMCAGGSLQLNANTGNGLTYQWNKDGVAINGATSSSYYATAAGDYTVSVSNAFGCIPVTSEKTTISIVTTPTVAAITGNTTLCMGTTSQLATTTTNGVWASSNAGIVNVDASGIVTAVNPGSATISYSINPPGCGTISNSTTVTVNALPTVASINGSRGVCPSASVQLTNATPNGVWSSDNASVATVNSYGLVSTLTAGSVTIGYTVTENGCGTTKSFTLKVSPISTTFSQKPSCAGSNNGTATVSATGGGGGSKTYAITNDYYYPQLVTIDQTTGASTVVGQITNNGNPIYGRFRSMAVSPSGDIYAMNDNSFSTLYKIDASTGAMTQVGNNYSQCSSVGGMAFNNSGELYTMDYCGWLYKVDLSNGSATRVATPGYGFEGIAFDPADGTLYGSTSNQLFKVNINNSSVTYVGNYYSYAGISDIFFDASGQLYGTNGFWSGEFVKIDKTNAQQTYLGNSNIYAWAMTGGGSVYTYLWDNGQTTATATNLTPGLHNVTVTDVNGCSKTSSVTITEQAKPTAFNVTGGGERCENGGGLQIGLSGSEPGVRYKLLRDGNEYNNRDGDGNPIDFGYYYDAGTYTIVANNTSIPCTQDMTGNAVIKINPLPDQTVTYTGANTICPGSTLLLSAAAGQGYTYQWKKDGNDIAGATNQTYAAGQTGNYSVVIRTASGCTGNYSPQVYVDAFPVPTVTVSGNTTFCAGDSRSLSSDNGGGRYTSYTWSTGANTQSISTSQPGAYTVTVSNGTCTATSAPTTLTMTENTLQLTAQLLNPVTCENALDGSVNVLTSGGTAPYQYGSFYNFNGSSIDNDVFTTVNNTFSQSNGHLNISGSNNSSWNSSNQLITKQVFDISGNVTIEGTFHINNNNQPFFFGFASTGPIGQQNDIRFGIGHEGSYFYGVENSGYNSATYAGDNVDYDVKVEKVGSQVKYYSRVSGTADYNLFYTGNYSQSYTKARLIVMAYGSGSGAWGDNLKVIAPISTTNLALGTYAYNVYDAIGCSASASVVVPISTTTNPIQLTGTATPASCANGTDGTVTLTPSQGSGQYSFDVFNYPFSGTSLNTGRIETINGVFSENNGSLRADATNSYPSNGEWNNYIYSKNALTVSGDFTIEQSFMFDQNYNWGTNAAFGLIRSFDQYSPYSYVAGFYNSNGYLVLINNGSTYSTTNGYNISPNTWYDFKIERKATTINYYVRQSTETSYTLVYTLSNSSSTDGTWYLGSNYRSYYSYTGGFNSKNWRISSNPPLSGLAPGRYTYTVTDLQGGCTASTVVTVPVYSGPGALKLDATVTSASCTNGCSGSVSLSPSGGSGSYSYGAKFDFASSSVSDLFNLGQYSSFSLNNGELNSGTGSYYYSDWNNNITSKRSVDLSNDISVEGTYKFSSGYWGNNTIFGFTSQSPVGNTSNVSLGWYYQGGNIYTYNSGNTQNNMGYVNYDTWYDIKMEKTGSTVKYYMRQTGSGDYNLVATTNYNSSGQAYLALFSYNYYGGYYGTVTTKDWKVIAAPKTTNLCPGTYTYSVYDASGCRADATFTITTDPAIFSVTATPTNASAQGACDGSVALASNTQGESLQAYTGIFNYPFSGSQLNTNLFDIRNGSFTEGNGELTANQVNGYYYGYGSDDNSIATHQQYTDQGKLVFDISFKPKSGNNGTRAVFGFTGNYTSSFSDYPMSFAIESSNLYVNENGSWYNVGQVSQDNWYDFRIEKTGSTVNYYYRPSGNGVYNLVRTGTYYGGATSFRTAINYYQYTYYGYNYYAGFSAKNWKITGAAPLTGLCAGTYTYTVANSGGCSQDVTFTITAGATPLAATLQHTDASCYNSNDGTITVNATGGTAPYQYSIDGETWVANNIFSNLAAGTYNVSVKDANNTTTQTQQVTIAQPAGVAKPVITVTDNCNGTSTLSTDAAGSLLWSTNETTSTITVNTAGTYSVTQTVNGCTSAIGSATALPKREPIKPVVTVIDNCDGTSTLSTDAPGTLLWSNGETTPSITVHASGYYSVTQTVNGCTSASGGNAASPKHEPIKPIVTVVDNCDGTSTLSTDAPGTLLWSNGETTPTITVHASGYYSVTQTVNGCTSASGGNAASPKHEPIKPVVTVVDNCDGTSTLSTDAPGTLLWSNGETTPTITVHTAGYYSVTQTINGCTSASGGNAASPKTTPVITISANGATTFCVGGSVVLSSSSATGNSWSNGETTQSIIVSVSGTYTVTVTGDCPVAPVSIDVTVNPLPVAVISAPNGTATCPGNTIHLESGVSEGYTFQWQKNGVNIEGANGSSYDAAASANYTVVITSSASGCVSAPSNAIVVKIEDVTPPTITCNANITVTATSAAGAVVNYAAPSASDNCSGVTTTLTAGLPSGVTFPIGATTVTYTATDAAGLTAQCSFIVTVKGTAPSVVCPQNITVNNSAGQCGANVSFAATETAAIPAATITYSIAPGSFFPVGTTAVTVTATNAIGSSVCVFNVTVKDVVSPVLSAAPANTTVECNAVPTAAQLTATDDCGSATVTMTETRTNGNCPNNYTLTRKWTATDAAGNTSSATQIITVADNTAPVLSAAPANVTVECNAIPAAAVLTATDNCGTAVVTMAESRSNTIAGTYTITRTWTATDACGNTSSKTQVITVKDTQAPVPNIAALPVVNGDCSVTVSAPTATDNCAGTITATTVNPTSYTASGVYTITWTYNDGNGNTSSQQQRVVVKDQTPPQPMVATLPTITGQCSVTVTKPTANDVCSGAVIGTTSDPLTYSVQGTYTIHWTYTDNAGNKSYQNQTVVVKDNVAPVPTVSVLPTISGDCSVNIIVRNDRGCTDGCDCCRERCRCRQGSSCRCHQHEEGNESWWKDLFSAIVGNNDCESDDDNTVYYMQAPTATDNCKGTITATTTDPLRYTVQGTYYIHWTFTDGNGNMSTQTQTVVVKDNEAPIAWIAQLPTISGQCSVNFSPNADWSWFDDDDDDNGYSLSAPWAWDNCAGWIRGTTTDPLNYSVQGTYTIHWKFDDGHGNTSTQNQTVIVKDMIAPKPTNNNLPTLNGACSVTVTTRPTAKDNCAGIITATTTDPMVYTQQGTYTIHWMYNDGNGNTSTQTQTVRVEDNTKPVINDPDDITISCGTSTLPQATGTATATDNCGTPVITYSDDVNGNKITRTWKATDAAGNTSTATQKITIVDNTKPVISAPADIIVNCGGATLPSATGTAGATDNCSTPTVTYSDATKDNVITRTWRATDASGNYSTAVQTITIGMQFSASISSVPTSSVYTGGVSTSLYLGYGAQSTVLQVCALPSAGAPYTYAWSGSATNKLNSTGTSAPVFTPSTFGFYTFTVTITNRYGCSSIAVVSICVTDIRVAGTNGAKVYVCHTPSGKKQSSQTLQVAINDVAAHLNNTCGSNGSDRLGSCDQSSCNTTVVNSTVTTVNMTKERGESTATSEEDLKVTAMPNPSTTYFTLKIESKYETPVNMRVMDARGRVIDAKSKIGANSTIQIGHNYSSGTYYAELIQGGTRKVVQLIKARG